MLSEGGSGRSGNDVAKKKRKEGRKERPAEMASVVNGSEREDRPSAQQSLTVSFLKLFPCR